ncbi:MAG: response regulator transcription factor [Acidobacteriia bacterium]|nr:response regulator transcription factor [Terriglobia bacterium]
MASGKTSGVAGDSVRVLVVDSTRMGTQLILEALRQDHRFTAEGVLADSKEFAAGISNFKPNVVVIAVRANGNARTDLDLLSHRLLREANIHAVVLLDASTHDLVVNAFRTGARGVICRDDGLDALRKCIDAVHRGQIWATNEQLGFVLEVFSRRWVPETIVDSQGRSLLSKRELDVVRCVSEGMTNREIASHLTLSEHTVKNYIFRTFDKLGVSNRAELILYAINHGCGPGACPFSGTADSNRCEQCTVATAISGSFSARPH